MKLSEVKELKQAVDALYKHANGGAIRERKGNIDKYHAAFNCDGRWKMCGEHKVFYDSNYGYYGNSSCYSQIELPQSTWPIFWKYFDEYLNENKDTILNAVCAKMRDALCKETDVIQDEIDKLTMFMDALKQDKNKGEEL